MYSVSLSFTVIISYYIIPLVVKVKSKAETPLTRVQGH